MSIMHVILITVLFLIAILISLLNSFVKKYYHNKILKVIRSEYEVNKLKYSRSALCYIEYYHAAGKMHIDFRGNVCMLVGGKKIMLSDLFKRITAIHIKYVIAKRNTK